MTKGRVVRVTLRFDGGHRRGIAKAAYGFTLKDTDGNLIALEARAFSYTTHNVAEYQGLIAGLRRAVELGVTDLRVCGDSRVVIYQMTGASQARAEHLAVLRDEARRAALKMSVEYVWNRRDENTEADALVNLALDGNDVKRRERPRTPSPPKPRNPLCPISPKRSSAHTSWTTSRCPTKPRMRPTERLPAKTARAARPTSTGCSADVRKGAF